MFGAWQAQPSQSAAALERQKKKERAMNKKAVHSKSFAQNMFRGILEPEQVFPYPKVFFFTSSFLKVRYAIAGSVPVPIKLIGPKIRT
jgi:hypothetical protein